VTRAVRLSLMVVAKHHGRVDICVAGGRRMLATHCVVVGCFAQRAMSGVSGPRTRRDLYPSYRVFAYRGTHLVGALVVDDQYRISRRAFLAAQQRGSDSRRNACVFSLPYSSPQQVCPSSRWAVMPSGIMPCGAYALGFARHL